MSGGVPPHLEVEHALFEEGFALVGAVDEVGRGSAFGPCCVGVVVLAPGAGVSPSSLRDSKLLTRASREALIDPLRHWVRDVAVGESSAREIDDFGLTVALRLAGWRALATLTYAPEVVILDGSFDWLSPRPPTLLEAPYPAVVVPEVRTRVKADLTCASVAAASVFAKVHRDRVVGELARRFPGYGLDDNKGYVTAAHREALRRLGPSELHRVSWKLPQRDAQ